MRRWRWMVLVGAVALVSAACGGDDSASTGSTTTTGAPDFVAAELTPLLVGEGPDVVPVRGADGRYHLLWEAPVQNTTSLDLTVTEVEVVGDDDATVLALDAEQSAEALEVFGTRTPGPDVGAAQGGYLFLTTSFDSLDDVPAELTHTVTITADAFPDPITTTGGEIAVDADAVVPVLGPPLEPGENYIAADGCCTSTRHIRAGVPVNGGFWFVQRFAIDWEQINENNQFVAGDPSDPASYIIYGKEALVVADGTVVHVVDGLDDQVPGELPGTAIPLDEADGNSVVIDIGDGLYAAYAHLQNGSVKVAVGDEVSKGDVVGLVGNTGNSSAPHLHFHVMDQPTTFAANGRPYVIDSFTATARGRSTEDLDTVENTEEPLPTEDIDDPGERSDELPLDLWLITFP